MTFTYACHDEPPLVVLFSLQARFENVFDLDEQVQAEFLREQHDSILKSNVIDGALFDSDFVAKLPPGDTDLPERITTYAKNSGWLNQLKDTNPSFGELSVVVVAASAVAANEIVKVLRPLGSKKTAIGKLYAKHFKFEDHQQWLNETRCVIGSGTPNRIAQLIEAGSLKLDRLKLILIHLRRNANDPNRTRTSILEIPETAKDVWALLKGKCMQRLIQGETKVALFNDDVSAAAELSGKTKERDRHGARGGRGGNFSHRAGRGRGGRSN